MSQASKNNQTTTKPPYRGDIIVDSSFLLGGIADIPKSVDDGLPSKKFFEVLPFLAKNGYHVIIPEMVAYETGNILASGANISTIFANDKHKESRDILRALLKDAALSEDSKFKDNPNIEIRSNTGPKEVDGFLSKIEEILVCRTKRLKELPLSKEKSSTRKGMVNREAIRGIASLNKERDKNNSTANDAIISLIEKDYMQGADKTLFLLADDQKLKERIPSTGHIDTITSSSVIHNLVGAGLGEKVGFPKDISAFNLEQARRKFADRCDDYVPSISDNANANASHYSVRNESKPFTQSLKKLAADLKQHESETSSTEIPSTEIPSDNLAAGKTTGQSRMDKFNEKYRK